MWYCYITMLRLVVIILVGTLALSFFGITIQSIVNSPAGQANFGYLGWLVHVVWSYIMAVVHGGVAFLINLTS